MAYNKALYTRYSEARPLFHWERKKQKGYAALVNPNLSVIIIRGGIVNLKAQAVGDDESFIIAYPYRPGDGRWQN